MRLIDKDAILHDLENGVYPASMTYTLAVDIAKGLIEVATEISAVPVVRGEWEINGYCSECRGRAPFWSMASTYYKSNYCPNCGCDMRGERDGEK